MILDGQSGIIEIDLHIGELLDDTHGMSNSEILNYQLDKFREVLEQYKNKEFFYKHKKIYFTTDKKREYEVFAVMSVNIHEFEYWKFVMARNKEEHDEFIDKVEEHSLWRQGP